MRMFYGLMAGLSTLLVASVASAALTVTVNAPGGTTYAPGETVTLDITVSTTAAEALALGLRAANYDNTILTSGSATVLPASIFNFSPSVPIGGLSNSASGDEQAPLPGVRAGTSINLFQGVATSPAAGAGPDSFQVQFTAGAAGTTTVDIGAFGDYSDTYLGGDDVANNTSITITVPEPASVLSAFAALGAVAGVVRVRRRA